jgi:hypothetical protein
MRLQAALEISMIPATRPSLARSLMAALGLAVLLGITLAVPARADDDDYWRRDNWRRQEWREHERREEWREREQREWCEHHPYSCGYPARGYVYAPPPVIYAPPPPPPPVVYAPAPSLDIVVPLHIR